MSRPNRRAATTYWDAGQSGCSQLVVGLKRELAALQPGDRLAVIARDPGAPIDIFVWCRMTGHHLLEEAHPSYLIERRASRLD